MKIMIIGSPGSGKSTYSREISQRLAYPIFYLDQYWHQTDYNVAALKHLDFLQEQYLLSHPDCIIDGNYHTLMPARMKQADLIIWLQVPRVIAIKRVIQRSLRGCFLGEQRPDMAANFSEHFDRDYWHFLKFIWDYPQTNQTLIPAYHQKYAPNTNLVILKNRRDKTLFLKTMAQQLG